MSLGDNLKRFRQSRGWTQGELSKRSGVKLGHISTLEKGGTDVKLSTIYKLMEALECSADSLLLDESQIGLTGQLKAALERANQLPDKDKEIMLNLLDTYCKANGIEQLLAKKKVIAF